MRIIEFHIEAFNYQPCMPDEHSIGNLVSGITKEDAFIRLWCKLVELVSVVDHEASTPKNMKEAKIWLTVVKALIWCFIEAFAHNASDLNKTCSCYSFSPEIERKVGKVKHGSGCFY